MFHFLITSCKQLTNALHACIALPKFVLYMTLLFFIYLLAWRYQVNSNLVACLCKKKKKKTEKWPNHVPPPSSAEMTTRLLRRASCLLVLLCIVSHCVSLTDNQPGPSTTEQGVTFSHVYKIDIPGSSAGTLECLQPKDEAGCTATEEMREANKSVYRNKQWYVNVYLIMRHFKIF